MTSLSNERLAQRGFTLVELMATLVIMAIVITIGVPGLTDFIASQRVRTTASDLVADMSLARAEAIKESRQAIMERVAGATSTWKDGWRICVDINGNGTCDAAEIRKTTTPVPGRTAVCATTADLDDRIVFRPDGRVLRATAPGAGDGIKVSDDNNDGATSNDRIRLIFLGISGRARMEIQDSVGTVC